MRELADALPGIERIKLRFLDLLEERQSKIAHHALAAWKSTDSKETRENLEMAQATLHQIAGTAGSLGFGPLGQTAHDCEVAIIAHLEYLTGDTVDIPTTIMSQMDTFVSMSQKLLKDQGTPKI